MIDLLVVMALLSLAAVAMYTPYFRTTSSLRLRMSAQQVAGALRAARSYAIRNSANVAVKFRTEAGGVVTYALYADGDGDGVRNADIASGKDPEIWAPRRLDYLGTDVFVGIPEGRPPRHPGNPSQRLDRLDDPIRFNNSDLASFSPIGRATPGSIYLADSYRHLMVVRTYHLSGKVTILTYDESREAWHR